MKINKHGLDLIIKFEGCKLKAYKDVAGIWTVAYGHTGDDVYEGLEITQAEADDLLAEDLKHFEEGVSSCVKVPVTDDQFSALVCFAYNVGLAALRSSTLLKLLNQKKYVEAANQFLRWNRAGGKIVKGLANRRKAERELFLSNYH